MPNVLTGVTKQHKTKTQTIHCCSTTVLQSMKLGIDVNRHKEIIVKAIGALLLLLLKYFKLNHVYQVSTVKHICVTT